MVAKVFLLKTLHFEVSPRKHVEGTGRGRRGRARICHQRIISVFFSLALYYIPTLTLLAFLIYPLLGERMQPLFSLSSDLRPCIILFTTFLEFGFHQADIQRHGEYFSTAFVLLGNIVFFGIALVVVLYGFDTVPGFLLNGFILNVFG